LYRSPEDNRIEALRRRKAELEPELSAARLRLAAEVARYETAARRSRAQAQLLPPPAPPPERPRRYFVVSFICGVVLAIIPAILSCFR
jgi:hypothetical protein